MDKAISISNGNSKMGHIPSVSLPPIVTCKNCSSCAKKCYAAKLCRMYKTVREAYARNLEILKENRNAYFNQVTAAVILKGKEPDPKYKICGGNCTECACRGVGCWELKKSETIAFYEH